MYETTELEFSKKDDLSDINIEISPVTAPLTHEAAWEVESLLLKIFEYGDYSFRSALSGEYSKTLNCKFFLAKYQNNLVGAAGCLYSKKNQDIAIVGPVGVAQEYRSKGIGRMLVTSVIEHLKQQDCKAAYLGVSDDNPAVNLYSSLNFMKYKRIVRRLLLGPQQEFDKDYFSRDSVAKVRRADWEDFPGIQALTACPCNMYTVDFRRRIFSSKYTEPTRFLSVFPEMMKVFEKYGGFANVLVTGEKEKVVGFAGVGRLPDAAQRHIAELDFFIHDNFIEHSKVLLSTTIQETLDSTIQKINCYCLGCDNIKRTVIESLGGTQIASLPKNVFLQGIFEDVLIYELRKST